MRNRDIVLSFRVTEAERLAIRKAAEDLKRTSGDFTRLAALAIAAQLSKAVNLDNDKQ